MAIIKMDCIPLEALRNTSRCKQKPGGNIGVLSVELQNMVVSCRGHGTRPGLLKTSQKTMTATPAVLKKRAGCKDPIRRL
jgi:hypothetical protein